MNYANEQDTETAGNLWYRTSIEVQREKFSEMIGLIIENKNFLKFILFGTKEEIQLANMQTVFNILETYMDDFEEFWAGSAFTSGKVREKIMKYMVDKIEQKKELDEKDKKNLVLLWSKIKSSKVQVANPEILSRIISMIKQDNQALVEVWIHTSKEAQIINNSVFLDIISKLENDKQGLVDVWIDTSKEVQIINNGVLLDIIKKLENDSKLLTETWRFTSKEMQRENVTSLLTLLNSLKQDKESLIEIWQHTDFEVLKKEKVLKKFIRNINEPNITDGEVEEIYQRYVKLSELNQNIITTIYIEMLNKDIVDSLTIEKMSRITVYPYLQENIIKYSTNPVFKAIYQKIDTSSSNWVTELDKVLANFDKYQNLINNIPVDELNDEIAVRKLIEIITEDENYFNISNIEEVKDFYKIRTNICRDILQSEKKENLPEILGKLSEDDLKRFAHLQLRYGINLKEAQNLIHKYGKDIANIGNLTKEEEEIRNAILDIKNIVECENINEYFKEDISKNYDKIFVNVIELEAKCINIYEKEYERTLYQTEGKEATEIVEYEDKKIDVYEINPNENFNMFVRVEGAYNTDYEEPENFLDALNTPQIYYHGNCKSYIRNDMIAVARPRGPIYGYSTCSKNTLLIGAPWDIGSDRANISFSTCGVPWDYGRGIEFRNADNAINYTRLSHNEYVSERLIYDEETGKFIKDKPSFVLYIEEFDENKTTKDLEAHEDSSLWEMTQKAAAQLGVPIVKINREKFVKKELERLEILQNAFLGDKQKIDLSRQDTELLKNMSDEDLIEAMIVKFENNRMSVAYNEELKEEYFSISQREQLMETIIDRVITFQNTDKYDRLLNKLKEVCMREVEKHTTSTGFQLETSKDKDFYKAIVKRITLMQEKRKNDNSNNEELKRKYKTLGIDNEDLTKSQNIMDLETGKDDKPLKK